MNDGAQHLLQLPPEAENGDGVGDLPPGRGLTFGIARQLGVHQQQVHQHRGIVAGALLDAGPPQQAAQAELLSELSDEAVDVRLVIDQRGLDQFRQCLVNGSIIHRRASFAIWFCVFVCAGESVRFSDD